MTLLSTIAQKPTLVINRYKKENGCVHSTMCFQGVHICSSFENELFAIPKGQYMAYQFKSSKFGVWVWRLMVKGHVGIEIHPANYSAQLKGCIAPVKILTVEGGYQSRQAFEYLMHIVGKPYILVIEIEENWQV